MVEGGGRMCEEDVGGGRGRGKRRALMGPSCRGNDVFSCTVEGLKRVLRLLRELMKYEELQCRLQV